MRVNCPSDNCNILLNSKCVIYEGVALPYSGINTNDSIQVALQSIESFLAGIGTTDVVWGNLTGDIEEQTDLITYLEENYLSAETGEFWKTSDSTNLLSEVTVNSSNNLYFGTPGLTIPLFRIIAQQVGIFATNGFGINVTSTGLQLIVNPTTNATGDIFQRNSSGNLDRLAAVATGNVLISGGVGNLNSWGKVGLTTHVSGILPIANGGTGSATQNFVDLSSNQTIAGKKSFTPTATISGINVGSIASDPSSPSQGDIWYNTTTPGFKVYRNGSVANLVTVGTTGAGGILYLGSSGGQAIIDTSNLSWNSVESRLYTRISLLQGSTNVAPLIISPDGSLLTTEEAGAVESDGDHIYWTDSSATRHQLDQQGGGGGITNGAAANEVMKSDGTNAVSSGLYSTDSGNQLTLHLNTADTTDNKIFTIASGGAASVTRGAYLRLYGNEASTNPDSAFIIAGENGIVQLEGIYINLDGARIHTTGSSSSNFFAGPDSANLLVTGTFNTGIGAGVFTALTTGISNVGFGVESLKNLTDGNYNIAIGGETLESAVSTLYGTAIGFQSLNLATGNGNIGIGYRAGDNITSGSSNVVIGTDIDAPSATTNGQLSIQNIIFGQGNTATGTTISSGTIGIGQVPFTGSRLSITGLGNDENTIALDVRNTDGATFGVDDAGNVIIGNTGGFTTGAGSIVLFNADTPPTLSPSQGVHIYSQDSGDSNATLALYTEQAVEAIGTFTPSNKLKIRVNGVEYWISLDQV